MSVVRMTGPGRRTFFKRLAGEAVSLVHEVQGRPQLSLKDIPSLPDDVVLRMVPAPGPAPSARIEGRRLLVRRTGSGVLEEAYIFDSQETWILDRFDGRASLESIATEFQAVFGLGRDAARLRVRRLFQTLAGLALFVPTAPPDGI
ncbi:MAG: hypothetical protein V1816_12890 [Pseudomonadota bacterium]